MTNGHISSSQLINLFPCRCAADDTYLLIIVYPLPILGSVSLISLPIPALIHVSHSGMSILKLPSSGKKPLPYACALDFTLLSSYFLNPKKENHMSFRSV